MRFPKLADEPKNLILQGIWSLYENASGTPPYVIVTGNEDEEIYEIDEEGQLIGAGSKADIDNYEFIEAIFTFDDFEYVDGFWLQDNRVGILVLVV